MSSCDLRYSNAQREELMADLLPIDRNADCNYYQKLSIETSTTLRNEFSLKDLITSMVGTMETEDCYNEKYPQRPKEHLMNIFASGIHWMEVGDERKEQ
jgi:hypothetical protein